MKVILSRKGFDSENGGIPSAIMPNGDVVSFPIPSNNNASFDDLKYGERSYRAILDDLAKKYGLNEWPQPIASCHVDPDLDKSRWMVPPRNWKPAFGPDYTVWHYLNETVGIHRNDIFLFFGTFHYLTTNIFGDFEFARKTGDFYHDSDLHLIWGYLQVGDVILDAERTLREYPWHPHAGGDVLIIPRKTLSFAPSKPGCGILPFSKERVLTKVGQSKAYWKRNPAYSEKNIIVAKGRKNSSKDPQCIFYSGIWQELGLSECPSTEEWAKRMILTTDR